MLPAAGCTLLALWLILWGIYHIPFAGLNAPLLVSGLACLLLAAVLAHEDAEQEPPARLRARSEAQWSGAERRRPRTLSLR